VKKYQFTLILLIINILPLFCRAECLDCNVRTESLMELLLQDKNFLIGEIQNSGFERGDIGENAPLLLYSDIKVIVSANSKFSSDSIIRLYWGERAVYRRSFNNPTDKNAIMWRDTIAKKGTIWRFRVFETDEGHEHFEEDEKVYYTQIHCDRWTEKYANVASMQSEKQLFAIFSAYREKEGIHHFEDFSPMDSNLWVGNFNNGLSYGLWYSFHNQELTYINVLDTFRNGYASYYNNFTTYYSFLYKYNQKGFSFPIIAKDTCVKSDKSPLSFCSENKGGHYICSLKREKETRILFEITLNEQKRISNYESIFVRYKENTTEIEKYIHIRCNATDYPIIFYAKTSYEDE